MNSQHLVEAKLKAPDGGGTEPGGAEGDLEPGQVRSGGQHLVKKKLKAPDKEGRTHMEDRVHQIWWRP